MVSSVEQLREMLHYDPQTGAFTWRQKTSRKVVVGAIAGCPGPAGYTLIGIGGVVYYAHRLAWVWMTGEWPEKVDHQDGDRTNNAWANLRLATSQQNSLNARRPASNTSGFKGVSWHKAAKRWAASIHKQGRKHHLGLFNSPEKAHAAYLLAAQSIDPNFARAE